MLESAAGQLAGALFRHDVTGLNGVGGGQYQGIQAAVALAAGGLSVADQLQLLSHLGASRAQYAAGMEESVASARLNAVTGVVALGVARAVLAQTPAAMACVADPLCRTNMTVAFAETLAGEALGGGTLAVGSAGTAAINAAGRMLDRMPDGKVRLITDVAGNTIDLSFTKGLTKTHVPITGSRGGVQYPLQDQIPNSYANLGNGHVIVYGPNGRALYDVSDTRIKIIEWNQAPNGQWFPKKGNETKVFEGNVPPSILNELGVK